MKAKLSPGGFADLAVHLPNQVDFWRSAMCKRKLLAFGSTILILLGLIITPVVPVSAQFANVSGEVTAPNPIVADSSSPTGSSQSQPREILFGYDASPRASSLQAAGDPYSMSLNYGKKINVDRMCSNMALIELMTWNQFTPAPEDYPFSIDQVSMIIGYKYEVGDPVQILIYRDPDGDVSNGADLVTSENFTVQNADGATWNEFNLENPVEITGPGGDVLVAAIIRVVRTWDLGVTSPFVCPAFVDAVDPNDSTDDDTYQARSYVGGYGEGTSGVNPPDLPTMPPTEYGLTEESDEENSFRGNLLIRAKGIAGPLNHRPVADDQTVNTNEDTPVDIVLTGSDPDSNPLTYTIVTGPTKGVLSGDAPNLTYTPNTNANGQDTFTFKVNDGKLDSKKPATVTINIAAVNDAPTASDQSITTDEDVAKVINLGVVDAEGDPLTYTIITPPAHGVLTGTAPDLTYTPEVNYNGADSFVFKANDGQLDSANITVSITINPVNDKPIADSKSLEIDEDTNGVVTFSGSDVEGSALTYEIASNPAHGTLSGTLAERTYHPTLNFNGTDEFSYTASDGELVSEPVKVSIKVKPVNDAPTASGQTISINEDELVSVPLSASDVDGDKLNYIFTQQPAHGSLSGTAPNMTYTPAANYYGADSFIFKVNDGTVDSNTATVNITIASVNDVPVANAQSINAVEDTAIGITLTGSDVESSALTYSVVTGPAHGTLSGDPPALTYTPALNYNGTDEFTFKLNDGLLNSSEATVRITIAAVNDAPTTTGQTVTTQEDTAKTISLGASDVDADKLTYTITKDPSHGSLSGTAPNLTYTPAANYNGADTFAFKVNDGKLDSNVSTVSITIDPVNDKPVANAQTKTTAEDTAVAVTLSGSDVEGSVLSFEIVTATAHGEISGTSPNLTYTPAKDYNGADAFTYQANDGELNSDTVTVSITVTPVNDAPVAVDQSVTTNEDVAKSVLLNVSDVDGDTLTYTIVKAPSHGALSGTAPNLTYTPAANYFGSDTFTYYANDSKVNSNTATVSITIASVNDKPVADKKSVTTDEDTGVAITLTGSDVETATLIFSIVTGPAHGTLTGTGANQTYTPAANYNGADSFTFHVSDGELVSEDATVSITVKPVNDAPVASAQSVNTDEDTAKAITLSASDVDGNALTYNVVASPQHGTLSGTAPNLTYTPAANYNGTDSFTFFADDGTVDSNTATVSITIAAVNDKPVADAKKVTTAEDTSVAITLSGSDVEGSTLTYEIMTSPAHGTLSGSGANRTYAPKADYNGSDSFTYRVNDGSLNSTEATVSITVTPVNDAPVASDQSVTTNEDTAKAIKLGASDVDGDTLTYTISQQPEHGVLSGTAPNLTYTPAANYYGPDAFTFLVKDSVLESNTATVSITVTSVNDKPVANPLTLTTAEDTALPVTMTGSDVEGASLTFSVVSGPSHGSLSGTAPDMIYTPALNYNGSDSFTYRVFDGELYSSSATVSFTVTPVNDRPVADNKSVSTPEDTAKAITLSGSDVEGTTLTYEIVKNPLHGKLSGSGTKWTYTPDTNYGGSDEFTYRVYDNELYSEEATVTITVVTEDDPPVASHQAVSTDEDTSKAITLVATDVENDPLVFSVIDQPAHGSLSGTAPDLVYKPAENYNGSDTFTFSANDGLLDSNLATVSITVNAVNDAPTADDKEATTEEDTPVEVILSGSDVEKSSLSYEIITGPSHGTLSGVMPAQTYTPNKDFNGTDSWTYRVADGELNSAPATVQVTVTPVDDEPVANNQAQVTDEDVASSFKLAVIDVDGDVLTYKIITAPAHGALSGTEPELTYTPAASYRGPDSFTWSVNDGHNPDKTAKVSITVNPVNHAPKLVEISTKSVAENEPVGTLVGSFTTQDKDPDETHTYTLVSGTGSEDNASFTVSGNKLYTAAVFNYEAKKSYSIRLKSTDLGGLSYEAAYSISVTNVNEAPLDLAISSTIVADKEFVGTPVGLLTVNDPDENDTAVFSLVSGEGDQDNSSFVITGNTLKTAVRMDIKSRPTLSLRVRITDGGGLSLEKVIVITVADIPVTGGTRILLPQVMK